MASTCNVVACLLCLLLTTFCCRSVARPDPPHATTRGRPLPPGAYFTIQSRFIGLPHFVYYRVQLRVRSQRSRASNDSGYISPYSQGGYSSGGGSARSAGSRRSASSRSSNASSTASRKRRKPKITSAAPETTAPMTTKRTTPPTRPPKAARASGHRSDAASDIAPPSSRAGRADLPSRESSPAWYAQIQTAVV